MQKKFKLGIFFLLHFKVFIACEDLLQNWPCDYLNPEIVHKINEKEIQNIAEIGADNELNALHLNQYYKCPIFVFESENFQSSDKNILFDSQIQFLAYKKSCLKEWMTKTGLNIDLLCVTNTEDCLQLFMCLGNLVKDIKYIVINNKLLTQDIKKYLKNKKFKLYFENVGIFNNVLFINEKIKNIFDVTGIENFNIPVLAPLEPGNKSSELIYAALKDDHSAFHDLKATHTLDLNYQDSNGNTALMASILRNSQYPMMKLLQQNQVDLSLQNNKGSTVLMIAAELGNFSIVKKLLDDPRGIATLNIVNNLGITVEETAKLSHSAGILELIELKKNKAAYLSDNNEYPIHIIKEKVVICGTCRNVANYLPDTIKIMEKIGGLFEDYKVVIYENNSTDETKNILQNWMLSNPKVYVQLENLNQDDFSTIVKNIQGEDGDFFKADLIARGRNIVLDKIMSKEYEQYQYMIMMDMDFVEPPPVDSILEVFQTKREWDAVFAYGIGQCGEYWDWYAFRDVNQPIGPELLGHDWFGPKKWSLYKTDQWCPVYSAFGGCGIYKKSSIEGCRYSGTVTEDMEKVFKKIISAGKDAEHPVIMKYLNDTKKLSQTINISCCKSNLPQIKDPTVGITLKQDEDALIWRMNSFTYQYPAVVDHLPFHASMIVRGHDKLFINPRLIFKYTA